MPLCGAKPQEKKKTKSNLLIQNQELLRLRLTHEEKVFYTELFYDNAVGGKVLKNNFLPLLGMLGTQIAEEFAERIFLAFSSNKKEITLCEYLKYIDIYHYGDDRERCRVTCKLIDKKSTGIIKLEDFKSYINLIMNAVKKVNGGSENALMSDQDVRDLFYHISKDKESFTYQEFEDIYKEKPELVSWFDYFKNNKEDMLLIINQNVKNLLNLITEFLSSFMGDLFKVLDNEEEIDLSVFVQKVYHYSNELEKFRKKFLKKISKFNIRTTFDKLQNNNKNQKTTDLINTLQKKVFNDGGNNDLSSSIIISRLESIDKRNDNPKPGGGSNFLKSFNTIGNLNRNNSTKNSGNINNLPNKKNSVLLSVQTVQSNVNTNNDHFGMEKFFKKIKNNLDRTLSNKNEKNPEFSKRSINNSKDDDESSSSDEQNEIGKDDGNQSPKRNNMMQRGSIFEQNFRKQQTMFGNKVFKFGGQSKNFGVYESSMYDSNQSPKKKYMNHFDLNINEDIEEIEDEEMVNETETGARRNSQEISRNMPSYTRMKSQFLRNIKTNEYRKKNSKLSEIKPKKFMTTKKKNNNSSKELISDDASLYDKSDYEQTVRCGTIVEPDSTIDATSNDKKLLKNNKYKSKSSQKVKKNEEEKNNCFNQQQKIQAHNSQCNMNINMSYANDPNYIPKMKVKKYILKIKSLQKQTNGLNQLLFCSRVAIENALDVCTTISSCYKWIGDNYLESQIKKVIKEAKLKEKQKEDKEKYGNIGNVPKKIVPAKKKIIRASDQSFKLLLNMIMGIQIAVQSIPNFHIKNQEDLSKYLTNMLYSIQTINFGKKKEEVFILKEFAGIIFNNIRVYLGYDKDDFIASISPQDFITELMISNQTIFEELCSTGKSGSLFYYTRDGKFIVKTIKKDEYKFIKQILPDYFHHLKTYPLSLLPKFLGCYVLTRKIKKKRDKIYFIVMINVFATSKHIHIRYDLKGSRVGRRVLTGKRDAEIMAKGDLALKDLDLEKRKEKMYIGDKNDILLKQIKNDADFLCKIGANDYSLLLGIHYINKEKKTGQHLSTNNLKENKTNAEDSILKESTLSDKSCDSRQEKLKALVDFEDGGIISETGNEVYFVGIIDILTKFNWKKKCEHFIKMVRYCSNNMSCTPPPMYRDRFVNYMNKVVQKSSTFNSIKNPLMERFKNLNKNTSTNTNTNNNTSNNILIQNNTSNYFNIINNSNNITLNSGDEVNQLNQSQNQKKAPIKKERYSINFNLDPQDVIKEESEVDKVSQGSSKKSSVKKNSNSASLGGSEESKNNN